MAMETLRNLPVKALIDFDPTQILGNPMHPIPAGRAKEAIKDPTTLEYERFVALVAMYVPEAIEDYT